MSEQEPPIEQFTDEELVIGLASVFKANDLRKWMARNNLKRKRGANKRDSARQAVEQDRDNIARFLLKQGAIEVDWERKCDNHEACGNNAPSANSPICDDCVDASRANSRRAEPLTRDDFDNETEYWKALHDQ